MMKRVDILVPIYNGLTYVKECVENVLKYTDESLYNLWLLDDASDHNTAEYIGSLANSYDHVFAVRHDNNLGFVKNCNHGFQCCSLDWFVLLNSDVLVTPGWLEGLLEAAESDESIAAVNPLTNHASQLNVSMPMGCNYLAVNHYLSGKAKVKKHYPDIVTGVGFCLMLNRKIIEQQGLFDEVFGKGYCEESDLCMRLTTNGYRVVLNPRVYVYHKGGGTFTDRGERYTHNRKIFDERWLGEYKRQFSQYMDPSPIQPYRELMEPQKRWDPLTGARMAYRNVRNQFHHKKYLNTVKAMIRGGYDAANTFTAVFDEKDLRRFQYNAEFSVTYVLHNVTVAGGVLSIIQLVNRLIQQGVDARIAALREYPEVYNWQLLTRPIIYKSEEDLVANFIKSDVVVATHWTTAPWVESIVQSGKAKTSAYFLQDYEVWFFPEDKSLERKMVADTYKKIDNKIVKSDWLTGMLAKHDCPVNKIRLGMNLDVFYPRNNSDVSQAATVRILAMARPRTPRRGFDDLLNALNIVWQAEPHNVEIVFFGTEKLVCETDFPFENAGIITHQHELAALYSDSDIFIDSSVFQGFGRTALEAMACQTAAVVTNVGGVNEYADHEVNCLMVPPSAPDKIAEAVLRLVRDPELRRRLAVSGVQTSQLFCHKREGIETYNYFKSLI